MTVLEFVSLVAAGIGAGLIGSIAGLASLVSYPALLATGIPPVTANVTNTVALFPGYAGSVAGGRPELEGSAPTVRVLTLTGVLGGIGGAVLLLTTPGSVFEAVVPFLILLACALLVAQPWLAKQVQRRSGERRSAHSPLMLLAVLLAAVYGAYFGAGLGVLLLGVLGVFLAEPLRRINALKNVSSLVINTVALVAFGLFGPVAWEAVLVIAVTALAGGFLGAKIASRIPSSLLRALVVLYGVVVSVVLLVQD